MLGQGHILLQLLVGFGLQERISTRDGLLKGRKGSRVASSSNDNFELEGRSASVLSFIDVFLASVGRSGRSRTVANLPDFLVAPVDSARLGRCKSTSIVEESPLEPMCP